jgi:hypothetical protein
MAQVLPFNGFYTDNSAKNSSRTCVNFMPVRHDAGSLSEYTLESTSGITSGTQKTGMNISGRSFDFKINGDFSEACVPFIRDSGFGFIYSNGPGFLATRTISILNVTAPDFAVSTVVKANNDTAAFVCESLNDQTLVSYKVDGEIIVTAAAPVGPRFTDMEYLGDRFIYMSSRAADISENIRVYYSEILDPTNVGSLNYFSDLSQTSSNTGIHVDSGRLYVFSSNGYSVWANSPDVNLPFKKQTGSSGNIGMSSPSAKVSIGKTLYFVGIEKGAYSLYTLSGGRIANIGNDFIKRELELASGGSLMSINDSGNTFVCIKSINRVFCYNIETGEYHERVSYNSVTGAAERWRVDAHERTQGKSIVFYDNDAGILVSEFDKEIGTEFGDLVYRECVTSPFNSNGVTNNVRELAFQTDIDYSDAAPSPAIAPQLGLSVSKTFGKTFEAEKFNDFDTGTDNDKILRFLNIGFYRQAFVFKLKTQNIYPHKILKMLVRLEKGFRQI